MRFDGTPCEQLKLCVGVYYWSNYCGVYVCDCCGAHKGLARCYCGWNLGQSQRLEDDIGVATFDGEGREVEIPDDYEPAMTRRMLEEGYWLIGRSTIVKEVRSASG